MKMEDWSDPGISLGLPRIAGNFCELGRGKEGPFPVRFMALPKLDFRSGLQNCETINVCCLSYSVCGIWLWQPREANTLLFPEDLKCPAAEAGSENLFSLQQGLFASKNKNRRL